MRKCSLLFAISIVLLFGCACSRDLVPDNILEGLHKPVINKVNPAAVQFNGAGFSLGVSTEHLDDDQYVLYINSRKVGQAEPGYWRTGLSWMVSKELISELLSSSPDGVTCSVRITSINQSYDISGDFDKYRDYVSEPVALEIRKGETRFSAAKQLFLEWTHSSEPIIRCGSEGNIYLAWREKVNDIYQAFFSFSADGGESWSQVLNISRSNESVDQVDLAVDGAGHFYLAWMVGGNEESDVFFCRSLDNGATWHFPVQMDAVSEYAKMPSLAVNDHGDVFLAWHHWNDRENPDVRLAVSRDLGKSWKIKNFAAPRASDYWGKPILASRPDGFVYLFNGRYGVQNQFFDIFSSQDFGNTWQVQVVATGDIYPFGKYSLARFGPMNQIYIVWGKNLTGGHVSSYWNYFLRRENSGDWSGIQNLQDVCHAVDEKTALSVSGISVDVVMTQAGGLFLLRSADEGRNWSIPEFIPGADGLFANMSPDSVRHPTGKTFLVFIKKNASMDGCLYLTQFE